MAVLVLGGLLGGAYVPAVHAQVLQQYLPDIADIGVGQIGPAIAPDVTATPRSAPETQPEVTVQTRPHPDYDTSGIHVGSFYVRPSLNEDVGYNSNLFADRSGRGALTVVTTPGVSIASDWSSGSLQAGAGAVNNVFPAYTSQNFTDWTANLGGTYNVGRDRLKVEYRHASLHIARGTIDSGNFDTPIPFDVDQLYVSYLVPFSRFSFEPSLQLTDQRFSNGTFQGVPVIETINTAFTTQAALTTRYELSPLRNLVFVARGINENFYVRQAGQPTRNSTSFEVLGGIDFEVNAVIRLRALAGYEQRNFTSSTLPTRSAPIIDASVVWLPSQLTTVTASVDRSIEDGLSTSVTGFTYTTARLQVDHELRRNIILSGHVGPELADFPSGQGSQEFYNFGAAVDWKLNRTMTLGGRYDYTYRQSSPIQGLSFAQNILLLSLKLHL